MHGCLCEGELPPRGSVPLLCPACSLVAQRDAVLTRFGEGDRGGVLPLFPCADGRPVTREAMVATINVAARYLRLPLEWPDGKARYTGHALRVGGAQGLAHLGFDPWLIALISRHSSQAVLGYIRGAPLAGLPSLAPRAAAAARAAAVERAIGRGGRGTSSDVGRELKRLEAKIEDVWRATLGRQGDADAGRAAVAEVLAEDAGGASPRADASCTADPAEELRLVMNAATNQVHDDASMEGASSFIARTVCGWPFGHRDHCRTRGGREEVTCRRCRLALA